jgi:hypothetical protein
MEAVPRNLIFLVSDRWIRQVLKVVFFENWLFAQIPHSENPVFRELAYLKLVGLASLIKALFEAGATRARFVRLEKTTMPTLPDSARIDRSADGSEQ